MPSSKRIMKQLFRQILVTVASMLIVILLLFQALAILLEPGKPRITDPSVLKLPLRGRVVEKEPKTPLTLAAQNQELTLDLVAFKSVIKEAQADKRIRGLYLEADALQAGWAQLTEMRSALQAFRQAGKFIIVHGSTYTQKVYYLTSVADHIVLHPEGSFLLQGLSSTVIFYKALLDKLAIKPQTFRVGAYKSAIEPFTRQSMSPASRQQSTVLVNALYDHFVATVAPARQLPPLLLRQKAQTLSAVMPQDAQQAQLVDQLGYFCDVEAFIKTKLSVEADKKINYVPWKKYAQTLEEAPEASQNQIAILTAEGTIVEGKGAPGQIGAKTLTHYIRQLAEDETVKAVVLRINSPGGSALASDTLWKELSLLKEKKPIVASMSDVAASGGYYLAAACSQIWAHPNTITGSIGIFGLFFDVDALLRDKLGISTDVAKTNPSADLFSNPGRPLSVSEKAIIQQYINKGYTTFVDKVAQGRSLSKAAVAQAAAGRVWPGQLAQQKGLVDELGGLEEAISAAAKLADLGDNYAAVHFPTPKSLWDELFKDEDSSAQEHALWQALQRKLPQLRHVQTLAEMQGIQARLPYTIEID